ncbi:translocation protein SEC62 isoform 1 [Tropilaelaps mercedesae]|uniref:Translocation protein SEC62 n=1 Tax=Tropilaelaps mercedesae TaxID=418985 RepID=A0A1V9XT17_9ACAR|nr:translocation protein SEC62 isoform 1 [Tropilaelaps mercedesae]
MAKKKETAEGPVKPEILKKYYDIAKLLKSKLPEKTTSLVGHKVNYFIGRKAIDVIMESKLKESLEIQSRQQACFLMEEMLAFKFFHRASKIAMEVKPRKNKDQEGEEDTEANGTPRATPRAEKGKKKFKLNMHLEQIFVDGLEPYVWLYDPIPLRTWVLGGLLVVAAIAVCMFPLWPRRMRDGVYYLSLAAAGFLGVILALAVIRRILFVIIFIASFGKHRLWILPNLTEDCGFFESFVPLYSYEYCGEGVQTEQTGADSGGKSQSAKKKTPSVSVARDKDSKDDKAASSAGSESVAAASKDERTTGSEESEFEILDGGDGEAKKDQ